jgi:hypothetical protein
MTESPSLLDFAPATATVIRVAVGSDAVALEFGYREPGASDEQATLPVCRVSLPLTTAAMLAAQLLEGIFDAVPRLQADLAAFGARVNALNARTQQVPGS